MDTLGSNATQITKVNAEGSRTSSRKSEKAIRVGSLTDPGSSKTRTLGKSSKCLSSVGAEIKAEVASISVLIKAHMQKEVEDVVEASEEAEVEVQVGAAAVETSSLPEQDTTSSCTPTSTA